MGDADCPSRACEHGTTDLPSDPRLNRAAEACTSDMVNSRQQRMIAHPIRYTPFPVIQTPRAGPRLS